MEETKHNWCLIPHEIWIADNINLQEKCLLGRIIALAVSSGSCFSNNNYLADELKKSVPQIKTMLNHLEKLGYIERVLVYKENSKEVEKRLISPILKIIPPSIKNNTTPSIKNNTDRIDLLDKKLEGEQFPTKKLNKPEITREDVEKLSIELNRSQERIVLYYRDIKDYELSVGKKYKNYPATIRRWARKDEAKSHV